jgi:hypothetical protein
MTWFGQGMCGNFVQEKWEREERKGVKESSSVIHCKHMKIM